MKADVAQKVKMTLLEGLKKDGLNWFKPWKGGLANNPINNSNGRAYRGMNIFILNAEMRFKGYTSNEWLTFKQCAEKKGSVKKGEKATDVFFWNIGFIANGKFYKSEQDALNAGHDKKDITKTFSLRFYKVFNIDQCENISPRRVAEEIADVDPIESAEAIVKGYKTAPKITNSTEDSAYYAPMKDLVHMPLIGMFKSADDYNKTLFHELVHSTGHESRLSRKGVMNTNLFSKTKGDYAFEELIAESGAMMLSGIANLNPCDSDTNSQAYINGWVKAVEDAKESAVVSALVQSTKAVDYILGE